MGAHAACRLDSKLGGAGGVREGEISQLNTHERMRTCTQTHALMHSNTTHARPHAHACMHAITHTHTEAHDYIHMCMYAKALI